MLFAKIHKKAMTLKTAAIVAVGCVWLTASTSQADERLWLDAKINGKRARLCFDSGADDLILWREGAKRLGLNFVESASDVTQSEGRVAAGITEVCTLSLEGTEGKTRFRVLELPSYTGVNFDGVIGWWGLRDNILQIDAATRKVTFLAKVPPKVAKWTRLGLVANSGVLKLEIRHESGTTGIVCVDTGSDIGVALAPQKWQAWKAIHPQQAMTFNSFFTPGDGLVVKQEGWAQQLSFGSLVLTGLPVTEATPTEIAVGGGQFEGILGLAALRRLDFIIDSKHGVAYLRSKGTPPRLHQHNRLGAAFVPSDSRGDELVVRVAAGSPAQEAGVENGDVLLKVDGIDVTLQNTDFMKKFCMAAGTKVNLTLKRNGKVFETTAKLREILSTSITKEKQ